MTPEHGIGWRWQDAGRRWVPAMGPGPATALKRGFINEGVDLMSGGVMLVSAAHQDRDVEATTAAFDRVLTQMQDEAVI